MLLQADQMHKMTSISLKMVEIVILSTENICQKHLFFHQLTHNLFIELRVQYMKTTSSEHQGVYLN